MDVYATFEQTMPPMRIIIARLIEYKYKCTQQQSGFVPDIIRLMEKYELRKYIEGFITKYTFPTKHVWRNIVNKQLNEFDGTYNISRNAKPR